jgi:hypothetical protein
MSVSSDASAAIASVQSLDIKYQDSLQNEAADQVTIKAQAQQILDLEALVTKLKSMIPPVSVSVSPTSISILAGFFQQFSAIVSNAITSNVVWSCTGGSISTSGLFTAGATAGAFTVTATSVDDPTKAATVNGTVTVPAPPPIGTDYLNLEQRAWAVKGGAGTGGGSTTGTSTQTMNADGSRRFKIMPGKTYDNFLWGIDGLFIPKIGQVTKIVDTLKFKVSDISIIQGVEWENQRNAPGKVANMAFCVDPRDPKWAYFYYTGAAGTGPGWVKVAAIPYDPKMFLDWVTVVMECSIDDNASPATVTHKQVTINGVIYPINFTQTQANKANSLRWDCNFQLDSIKTPVGATLPPSFYVDIFRSVHVE